MNACFIILCLLYIIHLLNDEGCNAAPTIASGVTYLQRFGYLKVPDPRVGRLTSGDENAEGLKKFQRFAGLPQTGIFDLSTLKKMDEPRCGNPDIVGTEHGARKKRYALQGSSWRKRKLTYNITSYTRDILQHETEKSIELALKIWEKESRLTFQKLRQRQRPVDIEILFASGEHGDAEAFDGPGHTLAHAFFPYFGGDAHFDEDETWITTSGEGTNLTIVAAHELGHSLGLGHTDNKNSMMAPFYNPAIEGLHNDDIRGIQELYGAPDNQERSLFTPPKGTCTARFDAITVVRNGSTFAFSGDLYWRLNDQGMEKGYPQLISSGWGFTGSVDAILTYRRYTDFFKGKYVRRFINGRRMRGYPKLISEVYPGLPSHIDAAYVWSGNGLIYFIKGSKYWRFNVFKRKIVNGYPRPLSAWKGLPDSIDAAFQWKHKTYFFKDGKYWKFDDERVEVAQSTEAPYPRRSDKWWLGCSDTSRLAANIVGGGNGAGSRYESGIHAQIVMSILSAFSSPMFFKLFK